MSTLRTAWLILKKDLVSELRSREVLTTMGLFALLVVVVFAFVFPADMERARELAPGVVWVGVLFAGTLGLNRVFDRERDNDCLTGLLLAPAGPAAVYVGKALGVLAFTALMELVIVPLVFVLLGVAVPLDGLPLLLAALGLGTVGFAALGTLFGGMLAHTRLREVLVPVVLYPVLVPIVIAGVELTRVAVGVGTPERAVGWLQLMAGFDLVFAVLPPWVFGRVMLD